MPWRKFVLLTAFATAAWAASDLDQQIQSLRPAETSGGEKAVLDSLQRRAETVLGAIEHARSRTSADAMRPVLRQKLSASLGTGLLPWPPRLRARTVGSISRDGYRVEKVVFESLPGVLVPAHLYLPAAQREPAPAVLFYVGHWWPDGKARPDFQAFCINMARLGFVVLAWDPFGQGERGISSRDHRRTEALLVGVSQQGFAEYETRCALEYLLTRREVDAQRVGMTGASGGGYNTWITAALDERIKVAVPVVGTSEFFEQISVTRPLDWYHASEHCHFVPGLIRYANNHELLAMAAPKPLMIIAASKDQSFPIDGVKTVFAYGRDLYGAYDVAEKIGFFEDSEEGHGYQKRKREAAYGWFLRWLMNRGEGHPYPEPETVTAPADAAEMRCFAGENQAAGPGMIEAVRRLAASLPTRKSAGSLSEVLGWPAEAPGGALEIRNVPVQRLMIPTDGGLELPGFLLRPSGPVRGVLIGVNDRGKEAIPTDLAVERLLANGWAVLGLDPRGIGELRTRQMGWVAAVSLLLNENFVGRQAFDITRAAAAMGSAFENVPIAVYARGDNASLAATYAIAASKDVAFYVLEDGFVSFRDLYERPRSQPISFELKKDDRNRTSSFDREIPFAYVAFGALRSFDISDLLTSTAARGLIANPINGDWEHIGIDEAHKRLPRTLRVTTKRDDIADFVLRATSVR